MPFSLSIHCETLNGFEISGGSLGMGLGCIAGLGLAFIEKGLPSRVCILATAKV